MKNDLRTKIGEALVAIESDAIAAVVQDVDFRATAVIEEIVDRLIHADNINDDIIEMIFAQDPKAALEEMGKLFKINKLNNDISNLLSAYLAYKAHEKLQAIKDSGKQITVKDFLENFAVPDYRVLLIGDYYVNLSATEVKHIISGKSNYVYYTDISGDWDNGLDREDFFAFEVNLDKLYKNEVLERELLIEINYEHIVVETQLPKGKKVRACSDCGIYFMTEQEYTKPDYCSRCTNQETK